MVLTIKLDLNPTLLISRLLFKSKSYARTLHLNPVQPNILNTPKLLLELTPNLNWHPSFYRRKMKIKSICHPLQINIANMISLKMSPALTLKLDWNLMFLHCLFYYFFELAIILLEHIVILLSTYKLCKQNSR